MKTKPRSVGKPTKYNEEMLKKTEEFIRRCMHNDEFISRTKLAFELGVNRDTLHDWGDRHPEYFRTLEKVDQLQEIQLNESGLKGVFNPTITKLMLMNNHGYAEKKELSGNKDKPLEMRWLDDSDTV